MLLVQRLLATLAIIDVDGAFQILDDQIAESLATKVVEHAVGSDVAAVDRALLLALQVVGGGGIVRTVEMPGGSRNVDARTVSHAILVNPQLVLVGGKP